MTKTAAAPWLALLGLLLAGCGGSSPKAAAPAGSPSSSSPSGSASSSSAPSSAVGPSVPAFASTSAGTPRGVLSKPDFLIDMNALCSAVDAQLQALPVPTGASDFAAINTNLTGTLRVLPVLISHAEALVARTAERAELEKNWLDVKRADYAAFKPVAQQMVKDANAHDAAKVEADANALTALPDHSLDTVSYLSEYGLTSCAHLEKY
ncbi:MAG TPA: hypothetical protein VGX49_17440 [Jatrophihabitans sp.]|jgi:hypothetical protein|nr:hypothetical protein [Jatrophihabitans sp.]